MTRRVGAKSLSEKSVICDLVSFPQILTKFPKIFHLSIVSLTIQDWSYCNDKAKPTIEKYFAGSHGIKHCVYSLFFPLHFAVKALIKKKNSELSCNLSCLVLTCWYKSAPIVSRAPAATKLKLACCVNVEVNNILVRECVWPHWPHPVSSCRLRHLSTPLLQSQWIYFTLRGSSLTQLCSMSWRWTVALPEGIHGPFAWSEFDFKIKIKRQITGVQLLLTRANLHIFKT